MVKEEIILRKLILHILNTNTGEPMLSEECLEYGSELSEFIKEHIANISSGDDSKQCEFYKSESEVYSILEKYDDEDFVEISKDIANCLYNVMRANVDIPSADLFVVRFSCDSLEYMAILKMNYKSMYTHRCVPSDGGMKNEVYSFKEILPGQTQKLAEAAIIRLTDLRIWLVEKKAEINGKKEDYFSEYFLKCSTKLSNKKKLSLVSKAIESVNNGAYEEMNRYEPLMRAKQQINEQLEKNGGFQVEDLGDIVYKERPDLRTAFQDRMEKYNLVKEEVLPQNETTVKKYQKQCLITDTGIEIKIPMQQYETEGNVEFITNDDGTISLHIKNIGNISAKF